MSITIQGVGAVGGFGCGVAALAEAMARGAVPSCQADPAPLDRFVPKRTQRRLDRFSRLAALAAYLALEDAGALGDDPERLGLVLASGYGATGTTLAMIDSIIESGDVCTSPIHFAGSLHNTPAAHLSILLGAKGPSLTVSQFGLSVPSALMAARLWLDQGRVDRVLFGAVDEKSELNDYLWARRDELERPMGPAGATCGEGAAFFLLSAREEPAAPYGALEQAVTGHGPAPGQPFPGLVLLDGGADEVPGRRLTHLWGCSPAAPAFDLAAAALLVKQGVEEQVTCLTRTEDGDFGLIRLESGR